MKIIPESPQGAVILFVQLACFAVALSYSAWAAAAVVAAIVSEAVYWAWRWTQEKSNAN